MRIGLENRKQVYLLISLSVVLLSVTMWEFSGVFSTHAAMATSPSPSSISRMKEGPGSHLSEPHLNLGQVAKAESTEYLAGGRNIFSIESEPVVIEAPLAPARPAEVATVAAPVPAPLPPIELKYLGYTRNVGDPAYKAVLAHKDESQIARAGDIVFHRYKVVSIQPGTIQITDLTDKNTQNLPIIEK
jgi:hypothetical protein